ncbi:MAG: tetratricopeptide repeat-containing sulfotransferase family protein [Geminicoccales bacterium]
MNTSAKPAATGTLQGRLSRIEQRLSSDPARADREAALLLAAVPGQPMALLFQGIARRLMGNAAAAIEVLQPLCEGLADAPLPHLQLGLALRESGDRESAVRSIRRALRIREDFGDAWLALADVLTELADRDGADQAYGQYARYSASNPRLLEAAAQLRENRTADAEAVLRNHLKRHPNDICALTMLADVAQRHTRFDSAEALLQRCLELAPGYHLARHNYAVVLMRQERPADALREADRLLADEPANADVRNLKATILLRLGEYSQAIELFDSVLEQRPDEPAVWANLGHTLRSVGQLERSIDSYRKAAALAPGFGEAFWNLANLKTYRLTDAELESMRMQLQKPGLGVEHRIHFDFAIGKALEDRKEFAASFRHYAAGNRLRRQTIRHDADEISEHVERSRNLFTHEFFSARSGYGVPDTDPVFIVGLPRSGSTLVEQILASHSAVEGTMELPYVVDIAKRLAARAADAGDAKYPDLLANVDESGFRELGRAYLERSRPQRKRDTPYFIDKMPNNFAHLGLILLILPNARIVDVRRHPLACGLSLFKHLFASGHHFSYSLDDIGRYYRDYVALMDHFDAVLPGRVHRIHYEALVDDTEREVRRLLDYCALPFETSCLNFFESRRAVSTPSSEQVRTPVFRDALLHWQNYEPWLEPLKAALGPLADPR